MGLLDGILGNVVGAALGGGQTPGAQGPLGSILSGLAGGADLGGARGGNLLAAAMSMIQQSGGLEAVLGMFREHGMGQNVDSWIGTGANVGITADQVHKVFGGSALQGLASQLGLSSTQASSALAQVLPELVNQFTPQGQVPDDHQGLLSQALAMLQKGGL